MEEITYTLKEELLMAIKAAFAGGKEIMRIYDNEELKIEYKEDDSPLTIADKYSNEVILSYLEKTSFPIISEESKEIPFLLRKTWKRCWIVDPLDGTKEFIGRNGEFTVNVAYIEDGKPVLGVIFIPVTGIMYFADVEEKRAFRLKVKNEKSLENPLFDAEELKPLANYNSIRVVGSRSHMNSATLDFINSLKKNSKKEVEVISKGSSLKFCLVAEGLADVYPRFGPTMEWDTAAGQAICEAVGLRVIDLETNAPMIYNRENLLNNNFIVSKIG